MVRNELSWNSSQSDIVEKIQPYFYKLYSDKNVAHNSYEMNDKFLYDIDVSKWSADSKLILGQPISKKELSWLYHDSLISMKQNKPTGYDGFPVEFYVVLWSNISDFLFNTYTFSTENRFMSMSQRNDIITLIPKKDKDCMYINYEL